MKCQTVICPICGAQNDELTVQCSKCHAYLQNRVPNIDLFSTLWQLIEKPKTAFRNIALAEHKNYSLVFFLFFGFFISFYLFSFFHLKQNAENLIELLFPIIRCGIILGLFSAVVLPLFHISLAKIVKGKTRYRNAFSLLAYASMPLSVATVFLVPIKLLSFGVYYFTANPSPLVLNAPLFWILTILDIICVFWSFYLLTVGAKLTYQISTVRSVLINFLTFFLSLGIVYYYSGYLIY